MTVLLVCLEMPVLQFSDDNYSSSHLIVLVFTSNSVSKSGMILDCGLLEPAPHPHVSAKAHNPDPWDTGDEEQRLQGRSRIFQAGHSSPEKGSRRATVLPPVQLPDSRASLQSHL